MTTGPTEGKCANPAGGPDGMPLALKLNEGLAGCSRSVEEMKARVYELNRMSAAIHEERDALEQQIAAAVAKYAVGQRLTWRGRHLIEVSKIVRGYGVGSARYLGRKVLKAGALGQQEFELWGSLEPANVRVKPAPTVGRAGQQAQNGPQAQRLMASATRRWGSA